MSDDMRPELDCYGAILSCIRPTLAALAKAGVRFDRGYCQFPLCCPSRSSMLSGRQVINSGVMGNRTFFNDVHPEFSQPALNISSRMVISPCTRGKIFHSGIDDAAAWTVGGEARTLAGLNENADNDIPTATRGPRRHDLRPRPRPVAATATARGNASDQFQVIEGNGENGGDYHAADRAIEFLRNFTSTYQDQPFFIGYGTVKPHSPPTAPQKFFRRNSSGKNPVARGFRGPPHFARSVFPKVALRPRNADLFIGRDASPEEAKEMTRAYLASGT